MEIINNGNRVVKLPPGFRFHPTDEELVFHYLKRKLHSFPLPSSIIPELDAAKSDPWDLPAVGIGHSGKEIYFFSNREVKYPNGNRSNRATLSGYWKATGKDKPILQSAFKKTLVFYIGKPPNGQRTDWIMHEYRLNTTLPHHQAKGNWVLCKIFQKKRNNAVSKKDVEEKEEQKMVYDHDDDDNKEDRETNKKIGKAVLYDLNLPAPSCSSSSGSSALTQISSDNDDSGSSSCYNNSASKKTYY